MAENSVSQLSDAETVDALAQDSGVSDDNLFEDAMPNIENQTTTGIASNDAQVVGHGDVLQEEEVPEEEIQGEEIQGEEIQGEESQGEESQREERHGEESQREERHGEERYTEEAEREDIPEEETHGAETQRAETPAKEDAASINIQHVDLDPDGDVVLICGPKRLRVSSKILTLSSWHFRTLLTGDFQEAQVPRSKESPQLVELEGDPFQPEGLHLLCRILHFKSPEFVNFDDLKPLADICHFQDPTFQDSARVPRHHVQCWLSRLDYESMELEDLLTFLWVTFVFRLAEEFGKVSGRLVVAMSEDQVETLELRVGFPERLKDDLRIRRNRVISQILGVTEGIQRGLQQNTTSSPTGWKYCNRCERRKPPPTLRCGNCKGFVTTFRDEFCDQGSRIGEYTGWLMSQELWPFSENQGKAPRSFLVPESCTHSFDDHLCGGVVCPLKAAKKKTVEGLKRVIAGALGLDLASLLRLVQ